MIRPKSASGRRVRRSQEERRVIRIHAEGSVTEFDYLRYWEQRSRSVSLDWGESGMSPMGLVGRAKDAIRLSRRASRRHGTPQFDEIWCVFDIDSHPHVSQAIFEATQSGIMVAVSNPCFELWLVLHCREQSGAIGRREIQRRAADLGLLDGKNVPAEAWGLLEESYEDARRRAKALDNMHEGNDSLPRSNPSSDVWRLVDRIRS